MSQEVWKPIVEYEHKYQISSLGSVRTTEGEVISQMLSGKPKYYYVNLTHPTMKRKLKRVHVLMAQSFLPNPYRLDMVDHIDRNKLNNNLDNLRWIDRQRNARNSGKNIIVEVLGKEIFLIDLATQLFCKVSYACIYSYLKQGLNIREAIDKYHKFSLENNKPLNFKPLSPDFYPIR